MINAPTAVLLLAHVHVGGVVPHWCRPEGGVNVCTVHQTSLKKSQCVIDQKNETYLTSFRRLFVAFC